MTPRRPPPTTLSKLRKANKDVRALRRLVRAMNDLLRVIVNNTHAGVDDEKLKPDTRALLRDLIIDINEGVPL